MRLEQILVWVEIVAVLFHCSAPGDRAHAQERQADTSPIHPLPLLQRGNLAAKAWKSAGCSSSRIWIRTRTAACV